MLDFFQRKGAWLIPYIAKEVISRDTVHLKESMSVNMRASLSECHVRGKCRVFPSAKEKIKRGTFMC